MATKKTATKKKTSKPKATEPGFRSKPRAHEALEGIRLHLSRVFALMGVAEEEMKAAMERHPRHAAAIDKQMFGALCPPPGMGALDQRVFRSFARELLERFVAKTGPLSDGTRAEAMMALSEASLRAPLDRTHQALFERLFVEVMGYAVDNEPPTVEPYPHAANEALTAIVRRCGRPREARDAEGRKTA